MINYAVEKNVILIFSYEKDAEKINKALELNLHIDDETEICEADIELLYKNDLISDEEYDNIFDEEDVTKFLLIFE